MTKEDRKPRRLWLDQHGDRKERDVYLDKDNKEFVWMSNGEGGFNAVYLPNEIQKKEN